jgi:hypothetical protein
MSETEGTTRSCFLMASPCDIVCGHASIRCAAAPTDFTLLVYGAYMAGTTLVGVLIWRAVQMLFRGWPKGEKDSSCPPLEQLSRVPDAPRTPSCPQESEWPKLAAGLTRDNEAAAIRFSTGCLRGRRAQDA